MLVFLDFEASSLSKASYPVEVAWVFEDGRSETHLIRPAPDWTDWDPKAEAIHRIARAELLRDGEPVEAVARRMAEVLAGHDLTASAPSWDGKWLSLLLRAGGLPRHALRLRDSDDVHADAARAALAGVLGGAALDEAVARVLAATETGATPAHRALPDAEEERRRWIRVGEAARAEAEALQRAASSSPA